MPSYYDNRHAEKGRYLRNRKNRKIQLDERLRWDLYDCFLYVCMCLCLLNLQRLNTLYSLYIYIYIYIYKASIYIYTYIHLSSFSSSRAANTYFHDSPHAIRLYIPSLPAIPPNYILHSHRSVVGKFLLVGQHRLVHVKGSIRERHVWFPPGFSSSVPHVLFVFFMVLEMGGKWLYRCCIVKCCFLDLFRIARNILV